MTYKWDARFLKLAYEVSTWSKDPSTKCGSVITRGKEIVSMGFNGFPTGVEDDEKLLNDREEKLKRVVHGEVNAIISAKQDLTYCNIYCFPLFPCSHCASVIIQAGIMRVIYYTKDVSRWASSYEASDDMFNQAGIETTGMPELYFETPLEI